MILNVIKCECEIEFAFIDKFNFYIKTPIIVNKDDKIIFFPTAAPESKKCVWICYNNVDRYVKEKDYTKIYFKGGKILNISDKTVRNHISNVIQKLGVSSRVCAVIELIKLGELVI